LVWIAVPQLFVCFAAGYLLRRTDPRLVASVGFFCICGACLMVAHGLTPVWGTDQFLPSSLLQSVGQSFALSAVVFFAVLHLRRKTRSPSAPPRRSRVSWAGSRTAFVVTFIRVRSQMRRTCLAFMCRSGTDKWLSGSRPTPRPRRRGQLGHRPRRGRARQRRPQHGGHSGIIDAFVVIAALTAVTLIIIVTRRAAPPGPASHISPFARRVP